jgi:membrane protease YdiL (CAAX protease family)
MAMTGTKAGLVGDIGEGDSVESDILVKDTRGSHVHMPPWSAKKADGPGRPEVQALSMPRKHGVLCACTTRFGAAFSHGMAFSPPFPPSDDDFAEEAWRREAAADAHDAGESAAFDAELGAAADATESGGREDGYWSLSRTPLTSLVFALPLVLAYEGGVLLIGRGSPRNGADVWLRQLLDALGFGSYFLLPMLTVIGLLAWHHIEHDRWRFSPVVLAGMAVECVLWAAALVGVARLQDRLWPLAAGGLDDGILSRLVAFCGAGLYEEVLFRLLLLPILVWACERIGFSTVAAGLWGLVFSSLLFSLAHYVGPLGDTFAIYSFTFRFLAGLFFAILFTVRGFGIAAGTHAVYDILVGLL